MGGVYRFDLVKHAHKGTVRQYQDNALEDITNDTIEHIGFDIDKYLDGLTKDTNDFLTKLLKKYKNIKFIMGFEIVLSKQIIDESAFNTYTNDYITHIIVMDYLMK